MEMQMLLTVALTSCFLHGIHGTLAASNIEGSFMKHTQTLTVDDSLIVAESYSRSMLDCVTSCQRSAEVATYSCTSVLYATDTRFCRHTVATVNDVSVDTDNPNIVFVYQKLECNSAVPSIDNGVYAIEAAGDKAILTCNAGYAISLDNEPYYISCDTNSAWTTSNISCIPEDETKQWSGRSFVMAFMPNFEAGSLYPTSIRLLIVESGLEASSTQYSAVTIEASFVGFYETLALTGHVEVELPIGLVRDNETEAIGNIVKIRSDKPVNVFAMTSNRYSTGGTMIIPSQSWSKSYVVAATPYLDAQNRLMIITGDDGAFVVMEYPDGQQDSFSIPAHNTYQITRPMLSGTLVSSDTNIAVLAGELCANLPDPGNYSCDNIVSQLPPTDALDTVYVAGALYPRETFALLIVAKLDATNATNNETYVDLTSDYEGSTERVTLRNGESIYRVYSKNSPIIQVSSGSNVMVTQYGVSASVDNLSTGDASMFVIPGVNKFMNGYKFVVPSNFTSSVMVTYNTYHVPYGQFDFLLNGQNITTESTVNGFMYTILYFDVNPGLNTLTHANSSLEFGAVLYGRNLLNEFAWILGMKHH